MCYDASVAEGSGVLEPVSVDRWACRGVSAPEEVEEGVYQRNGDYSAFVVSRQS